MKHAFTILLVAATACSQPTETSTATDRSGASIIDTLWTRVQGLNGQWATAPDTSGMRTFENWAQADSAHWTGLGYVLAGADTVSIEELRLVRSRSTAGSDRIAYGARLTTQNAGDWVDFTMQPTAADTLLFTNPDHDFPQRITYVRQGAHWHATIAGEGGAFKLHFAPRTDSATAQQ